MRIISDEWVEPWLEVWAADQRDPDLRLGAPSRASGCAGGDAGGYRNIAEQWESEIERRAVGLIAAALDDMSPAESCAVHHVHLHTAFRFALPAHLLYQVARQKIGVRLRAHDFA
jgi:hypothetical protein